MTKSKIITAKSRDC